MKISYFLICAAIGLFISGCANQAIELTSQKEENQSANNPPLAFSELLENHGDPPRVKRAYPPQYPREAKRKGLTGTVVLTVTVDEKGSVSNAGIKTTTNPIFNDASVDVIKRYKFEPAKIDGNPVSVIFDLPIVFDFE